MVGLVEWSLSPQEGNILSSLLSIVQALGLQDKGASLYCKSASGKKSYNFLTYKQKKILSNMISLCFSIYSGKVLCTLGMLMLLHNICETVVHYLPRNGYLSMGKRRWKDRKEMMCILSLVPFPDRCGSFHDLASLFFQSDFKLCFVFV